MVNIPVIAKRELNTYFLSLMAYFVLTLFTLANALFFAIWLRGTSVDPNVVISEATGWALFLLVFAVPMITMRLFSEEVSSGTVETLLTTPVSDTEVVLGKYMGVLIFGMAMLVPLALECVYVTTLGGVDYGPVASGFLGLYLALAQFLAIGLFCSSITRIQVGAAIMTFVILLGALLLGNLVGESESAIGKVFTYVAPVRHVGDFLKGVVDSRDLVYFVASTCMFLFLSVKVLELRRWR
jgi:ABC-2 type transport system permease protein